MTPAVDTHPVREVSRDHPSLDSVAHWLGLRDAWTLRTTFPQIYNERSRGTRFGIFEHSDLVTHLATNEVVIESDRDTRIRTLLVGSVATHPAHRRRGLAASVLHETLEFARLGGFDAAVLWSDLLDFYGPLGFEPAGEQFAVPITAREHDLPLDFIIRAADVADLPDMLALHDAKPTRVTRSLADLAILLTAKPMTTMVLQRNNRVQAYACYDKGVDFTGWWHELGGSDSDVRRLVETVMHRVQMPPATILVPRYRSILRGSVEAQAGCLRCAFTDRGRDAFFVDGLDSV